MVVRYSWACATLGRHMPKYSTSTRYTNVCATSGHWWAVALRSAHVSLPVWRGELLPLMVEQAMATDSRRGIARLRLGNRSFTLRATCRISCGIHISVPDSKDCSLHLWSFALGEPVVPPPGIRVIYPCTQNTAQGRCKLCCSCTGGTRY